MRPATLQGAAGELTSSSQVVYDSRAANLSPDGH